MSQLDIYLAIVTIINQVMTVCSHSAPNILLQPQCHMQDLILVDKWACARYYESTHESGTAQKPPELSITGSPLSRDVS